MRTFFVSSHNSMFFVTLYEFHFFMSRFTLLSSNFEYITKKTFSSTKTLSSLQAKKYARCKKIFGSSVFGVCCLLAMMTYIKNEQLFFFVDWKFSFVSDKKFLNLLKGKSHLRIYARLYTYFVYVLSETASESSERKEKWLSHGVMCASAGSRVLKIISLLKNKNLYPSYLKTLVRLPKNVQKSLRNITVRYELN